MFLRQSTASQAVLLGPFVGTDGAPVTGLTIDAADIRISKNGANIVGKNSGGATHDELGMYTATFDATDTDTVGRLQVVVSETGALLVKHDFHVLEEVVFDALFAASAPGYLQPTVAGRTLDISAGGNVGLDFANVALPTGPVPSLGILATGTLSGTHSSTTADLGTNAPANDIAGCVLYFPADDLRVFVDSYNTGTGVATFSPATGITLTNGDEWVVYVAPKASDILPSVNVETIEGVDATDQLDAHAAAGLDAAGVRAAVGLASANLDTQLGDLPTNAELTTALAAADDAVLAAIAALNNLSQANVRTALGLASANLDTQLGDLPTNAELTTALAAADDAVLAAIAAVQSDTNDIQTRLPATLNNGYMRSSVDAGLGTAWQLAGVGDKNIGPAT